MIKDFLIINFIGKENKIGLKVNNNFYIHDFDQNTDKDQLIPSILNMIKKYKVNLGKNFSIMVNSGPGSFSLFVFQTLCLSTYLTKLSFFL